MKERKLVLTKESKYEGLFDLKELKKIINEWSKSKNCKLDWARSEEHVYHEGKQISWAGEIRQELADWINIKIKLSIDIKEMQEVEVEIHGKKKNMYKGKVAIASKGIIESDAEEKWKGAPLLLFLREVMDKFITRGETSRAEKITKENIESLMDEIRAYFNLEKMALE